MAINEYDDKGKVIFTNKDGKPIPTSQNLVYLKLALKGDSFKQLLERNKVTIKQEGDDVYVDENPLSRDIITSVIWGTEQRYYAPPTDLVYEVRKFQAKYPDLDKYEHNPGQVNDPPSEKGRTIQNTKPEAKGEFIIGVPGVGKSRLVKAMNAVDLDWFGRRFGDEWIVPSGAFLYAIKQEPYVFGCSCNLDELVQIKEPKVMVAPYDHLKAVYEERKAERLANGKPLFDVDKMWAKQQEFLERFEPWEPPDFLKIKVFTMKDLQVKNKSDTLDQKVKQKEEEVDDTKGTNNEEDSQKDATPPGTTKTSDKEEEKEEPKTDEQKSPNGQDPSKIGDTDSREEGGGDKYIVKDPRVVAVRRILDNHSSVDQVLEALDDHLKKSVDRPRGEQVVAILEKHGVPEDKQKRILTHFRCSISNRGQFAI